LRRSACASSSADIAPAYVSPVAYQSYTCQQLALEAQAVSTRAATLSGAQDNQRTKDSHHHGRALATRCFRFDRSNRRALVHRCCRDPLLLDFIDVDLHLRQRGVTALDLVAWLVALDQISPDILRYVFYKVERCDDRFESSSSQDIEAASNTIVELARNSDDQSGQKDFRFGLITELCHDRPDCGSKVDRHICRLAEV